MVQRIFVNRELVQTYLDPLWNFWSEVSFHVIRFPLHFTQQYNYPNLLVTHENEGLCYEIYSQQTKFQRVIYIAISNSSEVTVWYFTWLSWQPITNDNDL